MIALKRRRRVTLGPELSLLFENRATVHPACRSSVALSAEVRAELLADLAEDEAPATAVAAGAGVT